MGFNIVLQTNDSEKIVFDKDITNIVTLTGTLKTATSIIDPVIIVETSNTNILKCNYMYIAQFKRYYFINNIVSINEGLWEISAHVDVLMSFKNEIRANTGVIHKQEKKWNLYVNDGTFKAYQNPIVQTKSFPSGFSSNEFIMIVSGGSSEGGVE